MNYTIAWLKKGTKILDFIGNSFVRSSHDFLPFEFVSDSSKLKP